MAREDQTKAERRQARAARGKKAERRQARAARGKKAERRQALATEGTDAEEKKSAGGAKQRKARPGGKGGVAAAEETSLEERLEERLAQIEEAVAEQLERSDELLERVNALLEPAAEGGDGATTD